MDGSLGRRHDRAGRWGLDSVEPMNSTLYRRVIVARQFSLTRPVWHTGAPIRSWAGKVA